MLIYQYCLRGRFKHNLKESNADADHVLISHETYALIKKKIVCEKKEEIKVKGIVHKVQTYQVIDLQ